LEESIKKRLVNVHNSLTVLFSGGVDSLLIAALCARLLQNEPVTISLVNVAFADDEHAFELVPDRVTGSLAFSEIQNLYPATKLAFVKRNISLQEYKANLQHVRTLMWPNDSVMDESIAVALWFAARHSAGKVLMVGMGADEQFGGYTRHMTRFQREGHDGFVTELQVDVDRIASRNLGRDDRVISDHGVEARYPFLDEQFVSFSSQLPVDVKMRDGVNKWIVRESLLRLGFSERASMALKRAIQFGARTAKMQQQC
jgi:asparagine synthetase B (glutamine-hydrolysing)